MKNYQGITENIKASILGKITRSIKPFFLRKNWIFVTEKTGRSYFGYAGIITSEKPIKKKYKYPLVFGVDLQSLSELKDDDIVLIEPSGQINVLWDSNSIHNSILATEQCNENCVMCPQPKRKDPDDLFELNIKLIKLLNPEKTKHIGITGGEPTVIGDKLFDLIENCKRHCKNASITLLTNGIKFKELEYTRKLSLNHHDLVICIPLYADNDTEHDAIVGRKGSFYETVKGIQNLALFQQKIEIRTVIHKLNYKRLLQLSEFIYHNFPFAIHIALMGMETIGLAKKNVDMLWIDPVEYMPQLKSATNYLNRRAMNVSIYNLPLCVLPKELWRFSKHSISTWKRIYFPACVECDYCEQCGGLFATSGEIQSKFIHPLKSS